jgi:hypothetical protein
VIGRRQYADRGPADLPAATRADRRAQRIERVDQGEGGLDRPVGAVDVELDGRVALGVQRQERGGGLRCGVVIEPPRHEHDALREELLAQPSREPAPARGLAGGVVGQRHVPSVQRAVAHGARSCE